MFVVQGDRGEFNQCQTQLKALYLDGVPGHQAEFVAYRILYLIMTHNSAGQCLAYLVTMVTEVSVHMLADMSTVLRELSPELQADPQVAHALKLWSAWALGNYCLFFRLYQTAPGMGQRLVQLFLHRERTAALKTMLKAYVQLQCACGGVGSCGQLVGRDIASRCACTSLWSQETSCTRLICCLG